MVILKNGLDEISRGMASRSSLQNMDFKSRNRHVLKIQMTFSARLG